MEIADLIAKVGGDKVVLKISPLAEDGSMGRFAVGSQHMFQIAVSDVGSRLYGSVKEGRDGGKLQCVVQWLDVEGKIVKEDSDAVKGSCVCSGLYKMFLAIPSSAKPTSHRLVITYSQEKLGLALTRTVPLSVESNPALVSTELDRMTSRNPAVLMLQDGRGVAEMGIEKYAGSADTYLYSTHPVRDRNRDSVNFGIQESMRIGAYGQECRSLVRFDLKNLPAGAVVREAQLQIFQVARTGAVPRIEAYEVLRDWQAGRGTGSLYLKPPIKDGEASWMCSSYPLKWEEPGAGAIGKDRAAAVIGRGMGLEEKTGWVTIPLDVEVVRRWIKDPASNRGIILIVPDKKGAIDVRSSEFEDGNVRPRLVLGLEKALPIIPVIDCTQDSCPAPATPPVPPSHSPKP